MSKGNERLIKVRDYFKDESLNYLILDEVISFGQLLSNMAGLGIFFGKIPRIVKWKIEKRTRKS